MSPSSSQFAAVIEEHLELKRRNRHLESELPLDTFVGHDPFVNHPLFKTEADARREEEETGEHPAVTLHMAEDTASMPVVEEPVEVPQGWMDSTSAGEFTWD
jgi:hypothetical protein